MIAWESLNLRKALSRVGFLNYVVLTEGPFKTEGHFVGFEGRAGHWLRLVATRAAVLPSFSARHFIAF